LLKEKQLDAARKDFLAAMEFPERLETAKPEGVRGKMVPALYFLGLTLEAGGKPQEARGCFERAASGHGEGDVRYYQALAMRKLGRTQEADRAMDGLVRAGQDGLQRAEGMDFFAKFGTRQSPTEQKARAHYLIGLGHLGKGRTEDAKKAFQAALALNAAHLGSRTMLECLVP
jgi:tetratricopeptide (TPR) repeat protein